MFEQFWSIYPRKQKGAEARIMWKRLTEEEKGMALKALPNHVALWKAEDTEMKYIPLPASWLNPVRGRRWEDEVAMPQAAVPKEQAWWTSEQGMIQKGRELGTEPQPGESWDKFKTRLTATMRNRQC